MLGNSSRSRVFGSLQRELTQSASSLESFFSGSWWCHKVHAHGAASLQPPPLGFLMQMGLGLIGFGIDSVLQKPAVLLEQGWWSGAQAGMRAGGFLLCQALLSRLPRAAKAERAALWPCHSPCGLFLEPLHPPYSRCKKKKSQKKRGSCPWFCPVWWWSLGGSLSSALGSPGSLCPA